MRRSGCGYFLLSLVALASLLHGQQTVNSARGKRQGGFSEESLAPDCRYSFTSGTNNTMFQYCVTDRGNIVDVTTPASQNLIAGSEGYGICNETPATAYWDYENSNQSTNWNGAVLLSKTARSVKIARTTNDGIWTLTQTITQDAKTPGVKVVMALKNNTGVARVAYLVRYADIDVAPTLQNNFDATANSASGWLSTTGVGGGAGLTIRNVGNPQFGYHNGFAQNIYQGPNPCAFAFNVPFGPLLNVNGSVEMVYADSVPAGQTKMATMIYRGL